ncbi:MAG: hypothetical protein WDO56_16955 [Gammaproteobacteria bacterium]
MASISGLRCFNSGLDDGGDLRRRDSQLERAARDARNVQQIVEQQ